MDRRTFIRASTGSGIAFVALSPALSCADTTDTAFAPWEGPSRELHNEDIRLSIVSYGILAPSFKNTQPWWIDLKGDGIIVRPEPNRFSRVLDPMERQSMISLGAFAETLVIAATGLGYRMRVTAFPDGLEGGSMTEHTVAAECFLEKSDTDPDPLFSAILTRRSNRRVFEDRPLSPDHAQRLRQTLIPPSVSFRCSDEPEIIARLSDIAEKGASEELERKELQDEVLKHLRFSSEQIREHRDGMTIANTGLSLWDQWMLKLRSGLTEEADTIILGSLADLIGRQTRSAAAFGILMTGGDSPEERFDAGRAFMRFHLQATALGVAFQPFSRVIENAEIRENIASVVGNSNLFAQAFFRLGYAEQVTPSPRRSLFEIVRI